MRMEPSAGELTLLWHNTSLLSGVDELYGAPVG